MARTNNLTNFLTDVSTAIKEKTGDSTPIPASQFDTKIASITTGGNYQSKNLSITQNSNYTLLPDTGYDAMDSVSISVNVSSTSINLFIQNNQPSGYNGIWIKSSSFAYSNVAEVADKNSLVASSINIVKGTSLETILFDSNVQNGVHYKFKEVYLTDNNNNIIYDMPTYYGNGQSWVDITNKSITILEYIQSTGSQYIKTGIYGSSNLNIYADIQMTNSAEEDKVLLGTNQEGDRYTLYRYGWTSIYFYYGASGYPFYSDDDITARKTFNINKNVLKVNGVTKITAPANQFVSNKEIYVFAGNNNGSAYKGAYFKLYSLKIYENDIFVRDFVPAKDQNGVVCLYDDITKQFFYNQGTGTFTAGPEVD